MNKSSVCINNVNGTMNKQYLMINYFVIYKFYYTERKTRKILHSISFPVFVVQDSFHLICYIQISVLMGQQIL